MDNQNCKCGKDSEVGTHTIDGFEVVSVYYCIVCYNKKEKSDI
jgi:hypothetical protein